MPAEHRPLTRNGPFRLGVNYWPARIAMGWWGDFDHSEVSADFSRMAASGFDSVRLFLTWEDFQPAPDRVDMGMLRRLVSVADLAGRAGIAIMPTLYTGHMSGVNWIPGWALGGSDGDDRFRVVSDGRVTGPGLRNWYADPEVTTGTDVAGGGGRRSPGRSRGYMGLGSRQRELELCDTAQPVVRSGLAGSNHLGNPSCR